MLRVFVGLALPESVRDALYRLGGGVPGARWLDPANYHVTLRFIGEVDEPQAADLDAALARVSAPSFGLEIGGVGHFGTRTRPSSIWAGVENSAPLAFLKDKVDRAAVAAGLGPDDHRFTPHITLARLRGAPALRIADWERHHNLFRVPTMSVDGFTLFRSHLSHLGAAYEPLMDYPLAPPPADATAASSA
ncbi:MAG: RNA 2',3'-cyclic phosphodiesterase [Rhodospirillaceae bacterium]|nr:RNA 2',3'-cyclic phosphodiesterase [Rhodospirillaceae bacterium]